MLRILTKEVHTQMRNYGVVTLVKCGLSSLLTFNIDLWAPILTNFLLSVGLLDNHGVNPYMRLSYNLGQNKMEQQTPNHPPPPKKKKNRKSRSSVVLCSETKRKRLLRRLSFVLFESFHKSCVHMHMNKMKFERNSFL